MLFHHEVSEEAQWMTVSDPFSVFFSRRGPKPRATMSIGDIACPQQKVVASSAQEAAPTGSKSTQAPRAKKMDTWSVVANGLEKHRQHKLDVEALIKHMQEAAF